PHCDVQLSAAAATWPGPVDARKKRTNGNENVAEGTSPSPLLGEILDGRVDSTAKKKNEGVEIEERRKCPDPLPCKYSPGEPLIVAVRKFNRGEQDTDGGNENDRRAHHGRDIGKASVHQQVNGALGQGVSAQQGADDVPDLGVPFAPAEDGIDAFRERAQAEREHAER